MAQKRQFTHTEQLSIEVDLQRATELKDRFMAEYNGISAFDELADPDLVIGMIALMQIFRERELE
jgi:hypothetical protein